MKLSGAESARFFARPDPARSGVLIYGADAMRVALKRQQLVAALIGLEGEAEMRLTRIAAAEMRKDGALLNDALRASGFFPGQRVVLLEDAGDGQTEVIAAALADWRAGDACLVVTAGLLAARSALRKLFEGDKNLVAAAIYDDPPSRDEVQSDLRAAGLTRIEDAAMEDLFALSRQLDPGDFRQTLEKIALFKWNDEQPLTSQEVLDLAPASYEAAIDDLLHVVAEAKDREIAPLVTRLRSQGSGAVALCIAATRHFRALHAAAADPRGPEAGLARLRPPVFGPRRDRMRRQAGHWGLARLETAVRMLVECDLALRSSKPAPQMAQIERVLIRLARLAKR